MNAPEKPTTVSQIAQRTARLASIDIDRQLMDSLVQRLGGIPTRSYIKQHGVMIQQTVVNERMKMQDVRRFTWKGETLLVFEFDMEHGYRVVGYSQL